MSDELQKEERGRLEPIQHSNAELVRVQENFESTCERLRSELDEKERNSQIATTTCKQLEEQVEQLHEEFIAGRQEELEMNEVEQLREELIAERQEELELNEVQEGQEKYALEVQRLREELLEERRARHGLNEINEIQQQFVREESEVFAKKQRLEVVCANAKSRETQLRLELVEVKQLREELAEERSCNEDQQQFVYEVKQLREELAEERSRNEDQQQFVYEERCQIREFSETNARVMAAEANLQKEESEAFAERRRLEVVCAKADGRETQLRLELVEAKTETETIRDENTSLRTENCSLDKDVIDLARMLKDLKSAVNHYAGAE